MLEHYHMSFLLTTENGNFLLYPIMFKNQIVYKADGLHSDVQNLELQGFYDSFLIHFKYPYPGVVGSQVMIGQALAYYGSSRICLVLFYLLLVSLRLLEARRNLQSTSYYGHVSIARLSMKDLLFPLLLRFFCRKYNTEDTTYFTYTFTFLPTFSQLDQYATI